MPRIRSIKPDFFKSEDVSTLPLRARLTWIGLWTQCDDHGRYKDSARVIKGDVWSLDDVSLRDIEEDLATLATEGRIVRYDVDGKRYLVIVNWHMHQAINRPSRPKYPSPPEPMASADSDDPNHCLVCAKPGHGRLSETSVKPHGALTPGREGKGVEGKGHAAQPHGTLTEATKPSSEPPLKCPTHLDDPDPPNCGKCADARRNHERWEADQPAPNRLSGSPDYDAIAQRATHGPRRDALAAAARAALNRTGDTNA